MVGLLEVEKFLITSNETNKRSINVGKPLQHLVSNIKWVQANQLNFAPSLKQSENLWFSDDSGAVEVKSSTQTHPTPSA